MVRITATAQQAAQVGQSDQVELELPDGRRLFFEAPRERMPADVLDGLIAAVDKAAAEGRDPRSLPTTQEVLDRLRAGGQAS